jgi:hypothetical protein
MNMKLHIVMAVLLATTKALNPLSVVSEAQHAESIAIGEGYKAVGKLTDSIRPSNAGGR